MTRTLKLGFSVRRFARTEPAVPPAAREKDEGSRQLVQVNRMGDGDGRTSYNDKIILGIQLRQDSPIARDDSKRWGQQEANERDRQAPYHLHVRAMRLKFKASIVGNEFVRGRESQGP